MCGPNWLKRMARARGWRALCDYFAILNGDQAYARYLAHWQSAHTTHGLPLSRAEYYHQELERRWNGVRRCC